MLRHHHFGPKRPEINKAPMEKLNSAPRRPLSGVRPRAHFLRNDLARVPKGSAERVAAANRTIFPQSDAAHVREQLGCYQCCV